jgi:hypothetical protein
MSDRDESLEKRITALERRLDDKSRPAPILQYLEKLLIPLTVALLALIANAAANRISAGQLALAQAQEERQQREALAQKQLKYMELVYPDLRNDDPQRQLWALGLLLRIDPESGRALADAVADNPNTPEAVRQEARRVIRQITRYGPLSQYVVNFLIPREERFKHRLPEPVRIYEYFLQQDGFEGKVNHEPSDVLRYYGTFGESEKNYILYGGSLEEESAERLKSLLESLNGDYKFDLREVRWASPGVISVLFAKRYFGQLTPSSSGR